MKNVITLLVVSLLLSSCNSQRGGNNRSSSAKAGNSDVKTGINVGERAPELVFPSPTGENISLSSLRGEMVLVDFWAAWCNPCRLENPNLVKTYQHFKSDEFINGSGFTVYSVSLDRRKEDWMAAIQKDGLEWEYHVSDLKGWQSAPAAIYGVMAIPSNFLIDGDGIIVAKGLRGQYLDNKLKELLKPAG